MKKLTVALIVLGLSLMVMSGTSANDSPPPPPEGGNPETEFETMVQMVSEDVLLTIGDDNALVRGTYYMRNQGEETESFDVRFPLNNPYGYEDIQDFSVKVDGVDAPINIYDENYAPYLNTEALVPWAHWHVTFPPQTTVVIEANYVVEAIYDGVAFQRFGYTVLTGRGWYGTILEGTITFRMPYAVNAYNMMLDSTFDDPAPEYYKIRGSDIVWHFEDLEPESNSGFMHASVMYPSVLNDMLQAEKFNGEYADTLGGRLWLARGLGRAINFRGGTIISARGGHEIIERATEEFQYVSPLLRMSVDDHLLYLRMLNFPLGDGDGMCEELDRANAVAPNHPQVQFHIQNLSSWCEYQTQRALTGTPAATLTSTTRPTRMSTQAVGMTATPLENAPVERNGPDDYSLEMISAGIVAIGLGLGAYFWLRGKRNSN